MMSYLMPKELDFQNLDACIKNYGHNFNDLSIILKDCPVGTTKFAQNLMGKRLKYRKNDDGIYLIADDWPIYHFPLKNYPEGFSMNYIHDADDIDFIWSQKIGPDDRRFPKPLYSTLITNWDDHLVQIGFREFIPLEQYSEHDGQKYWNVKNIIQEKT